MASRGRTKSELVLSRVERSELLDWSTGPEPLLALRSGIVLACAAGESNLDVAARFKVDRMTVSKWRERFVRLRLDGLADELRPGRPKLVSADQIAQLVVATLERPPRNAARWSRQMMADRCGLSSSTVGRIWRELEFEPHVPQSLDVPVDPWLREMVVDLAAFYLNPPECAVVLCVHRRGHVRAFDLRRYAMDNYRDPFGRDRLCRNISGLVEAAEATRAADVALSLRERSALFRRFLSTVDRIVPPELDVQVRRLTGGGREALVPPAWLDRHPRFSLYASSSSPWLGQAVRWLAFGARYLAHGTAQTSVDALGPAIREWSGAAVPSHPFVWTKAADEIADSFARHIAHELPMRSATLEWRIPANDKAR